MASDMMERQKRAIRILVVEDEAAAREGYVALLAGQRHEVLGTGTGAQALSLAATWRPDVILLDLGLPDIDGWEVARRLKAAGGTAAVPIVALTGAVLPHERASAMRAGCDRHLTKPCIPADLLQAIQRYAEEE
jgi:two-component system CheB/CheR fusion protein